MLQYWDVGRGALFFDEGADALGIVSFIGEHDGALAEMIEQGISGGAIMGLACRQTDPDRESLRIDDDVDLCREPGP